MIVYKFPGLNNYTFSELSFRLYFIRVQLNIYKYKNFCRELSGYCTFDCSLNGVSREIYPRKIVIRKAAARVFTLRESCLKEVVSENHLQLSWIKVECMKLKSFLSITIDVLTHLNT